MCIMCPTAPMPGEGRGVPSLTTVRDIYTTKHQTRATSQISSAGDGGFVASYAKTNAVGKAITKHQRFCVPCALYYRGLCSPISGCWGRRNTSAIPVFKGVSAQRAPSAQYLCHSPMTTLGSTHPWGSTRVHDKKEQYCVVGGERSIWLHQPCLLGVPMVARNQPG